MLIIRNFDGITQFVVCNEAGKCLIVTTSSKIAMFVENHVKGIPSDLRLNIGGDPGTKVEKKLWHHIKRYTK